MKNRVARYPGRIKLTEVPGKPGYYDTERADEPIVEGDSLDKSTFLKDATAALYGLGADAVPDEVLSKLQTGGMLSMDKLLGVTTTSKQAAVSFDLSRVDLGKYAKLILQFSMPTETISQVTYYRIALNDNVGARTGSAGDMPITEGGRISIAVGNASAGNEFMGQVEINIMGNEIGGTTTTVELSSSSSSVYRQTMYWWMSVLAKNTRLNKLSLVTSTGEAVIHPNTKLILYGVRK